MQKPTYALLLATLLSATAAPALAVPFAAAPPDLLGPFNGGMLTHTIASPGPSAAGAATLTFDLLGYRTVDGMNCCTDTFKLTINGNLLFEGGFDMGGGGTNFVTFSDPGVTVVSTTSPGIGLGGLTQFSVAHTLLAGNNTYDFNYGAMQGLGDEGWGLAKVHIGADVTPVPEPAAWGLMLAGLGALGLSSRRSRRVR